MPRKFPWLTLLGLLSVLAGIAAYNIWAYNCGFCAIKDMKSVGPQVKGVGFLVVGALVLWVALFSRRFSKKKNQNCTCGRQLLPGWSFCPDCGYQLRS